MHKPRGERIQNAVRLELAIATGNAESEKKDLVT